MNNIHLILMIIALAGFIATQIIIADNNFISQIDKNIVIPRLFP